MIPLAGQGRPLPPECPYEGEWLLEGVLFIYRPTPRLPAAESQFTAGFRRADGEWCAGFDSSVLAHELGVGVDELFAANRSGTLNLESVQIVPPKLGGLVAKRYAFTLGNRVCVLTIEGFHEGRA